MGREDDGECSGEAGRSPLLASAAGSFQIPARSPSPVHAAAIRFVQTTVTRIEGSCWQCNQRDPTCACTGEDRSMEGMCACSDGSDHTGLDTVLLR